LISIERLVTAIASESGASPTELRFACLDRPSALNGRNAHRAAEDRLARQDQKLRQRPYRNPASGRDNDVADTKLEATAVEEIRKFLGPEAVEAIRDLYNALRPRRAVVAPEPNTTDATDAADREKAARIYEDIAAIERRSQPLEAASGLEATDRNKPFDIAGDLAHGGLEVLAPEALNLGTAIRLDGDIADSGVGATNRYIGVGLGEDVVFRAGAIHVADLIAAVRLDSAIVAYGLESTNRDNPGAAGPYVGAIATALSGRTDAGGTVKASGGGSDALAAFLPALERFLFSSEAVAYLIIIMILYLGFEVMRKLIRTSGRPRPRVRAGRHRRARRRLHPPRHLSY
jgi:hypothetical protein